MADAIPLPRDSVAWFSGEMERKLKENDDRPGWDDDFLTDLFAHLWEEAGELETILSAPRVFPGSRRDNYGSEQLRTIIAEAADVANFAMMIADNARLELQARERDGA